METTTHAHPMFLENSDWSAVMIDVGHKVRAYTGGELMWTARQKHGDEWTNDYSCAFKNVPGLEQSRVFHVDLDRARAADDTLIRKLAAQVLGFPVDSVKDLNRRKKVALMEINAITERIEREQKNLAYYQRELDKVNEKLVAEDENRSRTDELS